MKITICGDTCPHNVSDVFEKGDTATLFNDVLTEFEGSDRVIVNLECALTTSDYKISKFGPNLKASPKCAEVLKQIGVTDCALANNHIFDYGTEGVAETIKALESAGLNYTGFGKNAEDARKNMIMEHQGKKVAIINVCEHEYCYSLEDRMGTRGFDIIDTIEDIKKAKDENDFVVVLFHGGKEQSIYPSPRLRKVCQAMVKNGADVVLCQHSHCIGCYEEFLGGHILYGQGNFHFIKFGTEIPYWNAGLIVQLDIDEKVNIDFVPFVVNDSGIELAKGSKHDEIMNSFKIQSDNLKTDKWLEGWREFCKEKAPFYLGVIARAFADDQDETGKELFAHYLRCEAHHDVWDELCKLSWETRLNP